ncbi:MAG: hypothetical protein FJ095_16540 [Deltaproteobacteria bacterium]|nr:hypothetical protein [Deltaproteobacteria bacterium]
MDLEDWPRLDRTLARALEGWRRRTSELSRLTAPLDVAHNFEARMLAESPMPEALVHEEVVHAVRERSDDPLVAALRPWVETLWVEGVVYDARVEAAVAWGALREVRGRSERVSARGLRLEALAGPHPSVRARAAEDFLSIANEVSAASLRFVERRLEREALVGHDCRWLATPDVAAREPSAGTVASRLAAQLLDATDELGAELCAHAWEETARAAMVTGSRDGWPVRPTPRWLKGVLGGDGMMRGLRLSPPRAPSVVGAMSYARALGSLAMRILEASRTPATPVSMHQHPNGSRRHARRALFSSVVGEVSFAERVLGLSRVRAREHRRAFARGIALSLRFDALRVLSGAALTSGVSRGREVFLEVSHRVLARDVPGSLLAVLPTLRPGDGAALTGALLAGAQRRELIERHDEDWYRNPRAHAELRAEDEGVRTVDPIAEETLAGEVSRLVEVLGHAIG